MSKKIIDWLKINEWFAISILVILFILIRLPGVDLPLHQDEYKWPMIVNPALEGGAEIPHPPLSQFIYRIGGSIVGYNTNFRLIPLFFGAVNLLLLYWLMKIRFVKREAIIASIIWIFSYFSVLASLMVDTDGQIMPFFFLLALIGYFKMQNSSDNKRYWWGFLLVASCILGFFIKVSFLLAVGAILADFLWSKKNILNTEKILKYSFYIVFGVVGLCFLLYLAQYIFPFFDLSKAVTYWEHFIVWNRGWFQTLVQCIKVVLYTSPFLFFVPLFGSKKSFERTKVFIFFLIFSFIFYILLFDFSIGALDRYLQLLVLPLTIITTVVISEVFQEDNRRFKGFLYIGILVALVLVLLQSIPHYVPPLHPKTEWINRVMSLRWNFLYPFSGGSGPLGFYVSFLFISLSWLVTFLAVLFAKFKSEYKKLALVFLIPIGFAYNLVFIEEYLVGYWNGYAPGLVSSAVEFIKQNPSIRNVLVYNDNGGNEVRMTGKYIRRIYAVPGFEDTYQTIFKDYRGHVLFIDIPRVSEGSFYKKYFDSCDEVYSDISKSISAKILYCDN